MSLKVKALRSGFYGNSLRREGSVFTLARGEDFSPRWMVKAWDNEPEHNVTGQEELDREYIERVPLHPDRYVIEPVDTSIYHADTEFDPFE